MFKIITIPFDRKSKGFEDQILSDFILSKKIKSFRAEFFQDGTDTYWTVLLDYDPLIETASRSVKAEERENLDDIQKALFDRLKEWRKERAEKEGVPVYIVGTNKELADIAKAAPKTHEELKIIRGFGKSKVSKFGDEVIGIIKGFYSTP